MINPFDAIHNAEPSNGRSKHDHREAARTLALAFLAGANWAQTFAILRYADATGDTRGKSIACYIDGCHFSSFRRGDADDHELLRSMAYAYTDRD